MAEWMTVAQAVDALGVSERTIRRRIEKGTIKSKVEDNRRMVLVDESGSDHDTDMKGDMAALVQQLAEKDKQISQLHQLLMVAEGNVQSLASQLQQQQKLLEYHQEPWYRRWFRKQQNA